MRYLSEPTANPYLAWGRLGQIVRALHPAQAFDLACHIVYRLPDSHRGSFGGGVVAHLVRYHGSALLDWIEGEAWRDVRFLDALSSARVARDELDPSELSRLRVATGARICIMTGAERDASYREMFTAGLTSSPNRPPRHPGRAQVVPVAPEGDSKDLSTPFPRHDRPPTAPGATSQERSRHQPPWWLPYYMTLFMRSETVIRSLSPALRDMAHGVGSVWFCWFFLLTTRARFLFPFLVGLLCITSATPLVDLLLVIASFLLAMVCGALAALVISWAGRHRRRFPYALAHVAKMGLIPFATVITLIARAKDGVIILAGVAGGMLLLSFILRVVRSARAKRRYATAQR